MTAAPMPPKGAAAPMGLAPVTRQAPAFRLAYYSLLVFVFLLFSRVCDLFLNRLHIPLISSTTAAIFAVLGGGLLVALSHRVSICFLCFTAWLTLSIPFAFWKGGSFEIVTSDWYKAVLAYFLIVTLVRTYDEAARTFRTVAYALAALAGLALAFGVEQEGRLMMPQGYFANPNELGLAMIAGIFLWWAIAHDPKAGKMLRIVAVLLLPVLLLLVLRTGSRAGLVCVMVCLPFLLLEYSAAGKAKFLLLVAVLGLASFAFLPGSIVHRFSTFFTSTPSDADGATDPDAAIRDEEAIGSSNQRLYLLRSSLIMTLHNPLFGVGPGNFPAVDAELSKIKGVQPGWAGTHNTFTQIASEAGIPALVFFVGAMVGCWRNVRKARRRNAAARLPQKREIDLLCAGLQFMLVVFFVQFFFIHMAYSAIFPAIAGLCVVVSRAVEDEVAKWHRQAPAQQFSLVR
jgi:O-antigen ligase